MVGDGGSKQTPAEDSLRMKPLDRPRLRLLLDGTLKRRLTSVVAGPGSGKSTLVSEWVKAFPSVWHSVGPTDSSLAAFAGQIVGGLRLHAPGLPADLGLATGGSRGPNPTSEELANQAASIAATLCQELDDLLQRDLVLVIDDAQFLADSDGTSAFLGGLCRNLPRRLHLVICSRESLPFPVARLQVQGEAEELHSDQIWFTVDEVAELMRQVVGEGDGELAERLHGLTGGWPVAVMFALRTMLLDGNPSGLDAAAFDRQTMFEYLAEEVIGEEPEGYLQALRVVAVVPWATEELVERLAGPPAHGLFASHRAAIYLGRAAGQPHAMSLTPLVRDFILDRYPLDESERLTVFQASADWYRAAGADVEALACLTELGAVPGIVEYVEHRGDAMVAAGLARDVIKAVAGIPVENRSNSVLLIEAESRQSLGDWEGASRCYELLAPPSGPMDPGLAWRWGFLHHMRGDSATAFEMYGRGKLGTGNLVDEAALLSWTASAHWLRGDREAASAAAHQALDLARRADDSRSLAAAHTVLAMVAALDSDRAANDAHYLRALDHAERSRDVMQTIRIRTNRGSHFLEEGDFDEALAETDIALRLAELCGFEMWRGMALANRGQIMYSRGRLDEAAGDLEQARSIFRRLGSTLEAYPLSHMGEVFEARGDRAMARACFQEAVNLAEGPEDLQALTPALAGLARVIAVDLPEEAAELAERAASVPFVIGHGKALLAGGLVALVRGDVDRARTLAEAAASLAHSRRDKPGLGEALELGAMVGLDAVARPLLEQARSVWLGIDNPVGVARVDLALAAIEGGIDGAFRAENSAAVLQKAGAKAAALQGLRLAEDLLRATSASVRIKTLGGFGLVIENESVPGSVWQSRVAREVLWMLVANRGRPLHRGVIVDRLWPEDDPAKAGNRLSVALTTIRRVLDPGRCHGSDYYVSGDRDSVALNLETVQVDLELFFEEAGRGRRLLRGGAGEQGLAALRSAEARYVGEFLDEEPYADWTVSVREEARALYMTVGEELARAAAESGDHDGAARLYLRLLERDPYNEPVHLWLVTAMLAGRRFGTARRLYGIYCSRMNELEIEPAPFPGR